MAFILRERSEYRMKCEKARLNPSKFLSCIIDGADQSVFGLPHFSSSTKDQMGYPLKVKLIGVLEHSVKNRLMLLILTENYESGSNHIIEAIHRFLIHRKAGTSLPPTFFHSNGQLYKRK